MTIQRKDATEKYAALKEKAKGISPLSAHQVSGIIDRCNNAISGEYFKPHTYSPNEYDTKRSENKK